MKYYISCTAKHKKHYPDHCIERSCKFCWLWKFKEHFKNMERESVIVRVEIGKVLFLVGENE